MPVVRALAIAGDRVAGGVGTHETALATPDRVEPRRALRASRLQRRARPLPELGARPAGGPARGHGFAGRGARARVARPLGTDRARALAARPRLAERRLVAAGRADAAGARRGDRRHADGAHGARLPLAVAQLGRARRRRTATSRSRAASSSSTSAASRPASCARSRPGASATATCSRRTTSSSTRCATGLRIAASRGVTVRPRQGRLARRAALLAAARRGRRAHASRLAVAALRPRRPPRGARLPLGPRRRPAADRLPEGLHGRHARLEDRAPARRLGRGDHEPRASSPRSSAPVRAPAGRWPCTRSATWRTATRSTPSRRRATSGRRSGLRPRIEHAQLLAAGGHPPLRASSASPPRVQFSHAPSDRDIAERNWAGKTDGAYAYRSLLDSGAVVANGSDAPIEELDPLAGIRAGVLRTLDDREPWHPEQAVTVEQALEATIVTPGLARPATSAAAASSSRGTSPTSSSWTATRSRSRRRNYRRSESSRRWSAAAGRTTRRPGTSASGLPGPSRSRDVAHVRRLSPRVGLVPLGGAARDASSRPTCDARKSSLASTPSGTYSTRKRSFGEWMFPPAGRIR